jgi:hypothetical protein
VVDYEEAFKLELIEFSECIRSGREPRTPGIDGLRDVALCEAIARAHVTGAPVDRPTESAALPDDRPTEMAAAKDGAAGP